MAVCAAVAPPAIADNKQDRLIEVRRAFEPKVQNLPNESRVVDRGWLKAVCEGPEQQSTVEQWLAQRGAVVLESEPAGLTLHFFAEGIKAMTPADRVWEGLPRRADTLQDLIDHAIARTRKAQRPIDKLIITGHAGLPGCSALGSTLRDCVFEGRLSPYQTRQLHRLRRYLASDAQIELRQCGTGSGQQGINLLRAIHQTTGATVSSYLSDFHFGDSAAHPRIVFSDTGVSFDQPDLDKR